LQARAERRSCHPIADKKGTPGSLAAPAGDLPYHLSTACIPCPRTNMFNDETHVQRLVHAGRSSASVPSQHGGSSFSQSSLIELSSGHADRLVANADQSEDCWSVVSVVGVGVCVLRGDVLGGGSGGGWGVVSWRPPTHTQGNQAAAHTHVTAEQNATPPHLDPLHRQRFELGKPDLHLPAVHKLKIQESEVGGVGLCEADVLQVRVGVEGQGVGFFMVGGWAASLRQDSGCSSSESQPPEHSSVAMTHKKGPEKIDYVPLQCERGGRGTRPAAAGA